MMYEIIEGDCLQIAPTLTGVDAVVSDPPYGMAHNTNYKRFTGGAHENHAFAPIFGDDAPFDPAPWLAYPRVTLFGSNHFAAHLPTGTTLVWYKRRANKTGTFLSDCELAWQKGGKGVYLFHHVWDGFDRASERGKTLHPTQKPVMLMEWVLDRLKLPSGATILDPYCGSGSTGVAALNRGYNFIGIEREPQYAAIARQRLDCAQNKDKET
jgi:DNA modification methylase